MRTLTDPARRRRPPCGPVPARPAFARPALACLGAWLIVPPAMGLGTDDGPAILARCARALRDTPAIAYDARFESFGEQATWPAYEGSVVIDRSSPDTLPRIALDARRTDRLAPTGFRAAFDGRVVRWVAGDAEVGSEEDLGADASWEDWTRATARLGRAGASLILFEHAARDPLRRVLERDSIELQGRAIVEGRECDVVFVDVTPDGAPFHRERRMFIDTSDHLPRRVETLTWRDGRIGGSALTITSLSAPGSVPPGAFQIERTFREASTDDAPAAPMLEVGSAAPAWTLRDEHGVEMSLDELRGRVVVLDFWAEWCVPCRAAMPGLQALHEEFGADGVVVLGLHCAASSGADPLRYPKRMGYTFGQLLEADEVAQAYRVQALPTTYVIDPEGRVALAMRGFGPGGDPESAHALVRDAIVSLLRR